MGVLRDTARRSLGGTVHCRGGTIAFGADKDTLLSRTAANTLALGSGDTLLAPGSITVGVNLTAYGTVKAEGGVITKQETGDITVASLTTDGQMKLQICDGTPRFICRMSGTTFYADLSQYS